VKLTEAKLIFESSSEEPVAKGLETRNRRPMRERQVSHGGEGAGRAYRNKVKTRIAQADYRE
jgi:hypothetical protein